MREIKKKPSRQSDELSGRTRGSSSEVWAMHVAIYRLRGFDLTLSDVTSVVM